MHFLLMMLIILFLNFLGPRSDEHVAKRELYNSIIETGEMPNLKTINPPGGTKDIFDIYITGMGLNIF